MAQGTLGRRIQNITVADIMDREPVTIPAALSLLDAQEQFFMRYRWPWFAVVDPARHFLGVVRGQRVDDEISAGRPALEIAEVLEHDLPVRIDERQPLEALLGSEGLGRLGAIVAVDQDGVLQGVVTLAAGAPGAAPGGAGLDRRTRGGWGRRWWRTPPRYRVAGAPSAIADDPRSHARARRPDHRRRSSRPTRRPGRRREGASVAIMSKVHPVRSHSVAAAGGINAAIA